MIAKRLLLSSSSNQRHAKVLLGRLLMSQRMNPSMIQPSALEVIFGKFAFSSSSFTSTARPPTFDGLSHQQQNVTVERTPAASNDSVGAMNSSRNDKKMTPDDKALSGASAGACGTPISDVDEEDEQEEMFVEPHESFEFRGKEWGGPTRGGRLPEPTRYGDWERKGRCSDF